MGQLVGTRGGHVVVVRSVSEKSLRAIRKRKFIDHYGPLPSDGQVWAVVRVCGAYWCVRPEHARLMTLQQAGQWAQRNRTATGKQHVSATAPLVLPASR